MFSFRQIGLPRHIIPRVDKQSGHPITNYYIAGEYYEVTTAIHYQDPLTVLYTYDYLLNLGKEVELMWPAPLRFATILYFTTRYLPFVKLIFDLSTIHDFAEPNASKTVVLFVQTYAVYGRSWLILATLGPLGVVLIIIDAMEYTMPNCSLTPLADRAFYSRPIVRKQGTPLRNAASGSGLTKLILVETLCFSGVCVLRLFNALWILLGPTTSNLGVNPFALPLRASHNPYEMSTDALALTTCPHLIWVDPHPRRLEAIEEGSTRSTIHDGDTTDSVSSIYHNSTTEDTWASEFGR
ncbi:hypothetical protein BU17DRAFT_64250 [Hysterangium stoloniferum]|nr:hypothetical protein BU17DRAFT_64250 [Hysterangium stoloniferum]